MADVYTYDLTTDIGKLRLAIGDEQIADEGAGPKPNGGHLSDAELTAFLAQAGRWELAVPHIMRALAIRFSTMATSVTMDGYAESYSGTASQLLAAAAAWEKTNAGGGIQPATVDSGFGSKTDAPQPFTMLMYGQVP